MPILSPPPINISIQRFIEVYVKENGLGWSKGLHSGLAIENCSRKNLSRQIAFCRPPLMRRRGHYCASVARYLAEYKQLTTVLRVKLAIKNKKWLISKKR